MRERIACKDWSQVHAWIWFGGSGSSSAKSVSVVVLGNDKGLWCLF